MDRQWRYPIMHHAACLALTRDKVDTNTKALCIDTACGIGRVQKGGAYLHAADPNSNRWEGHPVATNIKFTLRRPGGFSISPLGAINFFGAINFSAAICSLVQRQVTNNTPRLAKYT